MRLPKEFETERLLLRPPVLKDALEIFNQYAQDPAVTKYLVWEPHANLEETRQFLARCVQVWQKGSAFPWVLIRKQDQQLLGMVEVRVEGHKANLGYVLAKSFWRKGYASEAVKHLVDYLLAQPEIYRVWADCDIDNIGSARTMEKIGMQCEGILKRWIVHPNISPKPRDSFCYSLVK